jgi:hypothetical protein
MMPNPSMQLSDCVNAVIKQVSFGVARVRVGGAKKMMQKILTSIQLVTSILIGFKVNGLAQ